MPPPDPQGVAAGRRFAPEVAATPNVPIAGKSEQDIIADEMLKQHRLGQMLEQDQQAAEKNPFRNIRYKTLGKGSLTSFRYLFWKHDPYPLVLVSSLYTMAPKPNMLAGINLHYLTFNYMKYLIRMYCGKQFSYPMIKNNIYIYNAFRTYKRNGIQLLKLLDCDYLMTVLGAVRSFKPSEIEAIRKYVQEQLRKKMNPTAEDISAEYESMIVNEPREWAPPYHWIPKPARGDFRRMPERDMGARRNPNEPGVLPPE